MKPDTFTVEKGEPIVDALHRAKEVGGTFVEQQTEKESQVYYFDFPEYQIAIYEKDEMVSGIWYNDPTGREENEIEAKIKSYLDFYRKAGEWEKRLESGGIDHYYNDVDNYHMAYGVGNDVMRFNFLQ